MPPEHFDLEQQLKKAASRDMGRLAAQGWIGMYNLVIPSLPTKFVKNRLRDKAYKPVEIVINFRKKQLLYPKIHQAANLFLA